MSMSGSCEGVVEPQRGAEATLVLVVDDDCDQRAVLSEVLEDEGYEVAQAGNGRLALERLLDREQVRPSVILLDLGMPVMSGRELLTILQARPGLSSIPVVLLSGSDVEAEQPQQAAIAGVLLKPYSVAALLEVVESIVADAAHPTSR
jgi:CheY-like chemotaxis protein